MIKRVYIDTSVVGGQFDQEFSADTKPFFAAVMAGKFMVILSDLLEAELVRAPPQVSISLMGRAGGPGAELVRAPPQVRDFLITLPVLQIERIRLTQDAADLADQYIAAKVIGPTSRADCQHIAMATLAKADVLVSWNFKHIVNLDRIRGYNGLNYQLGHHMLEIRTPKEIISYDNSEL